MKPGVHYKIISMLSLAGLLYFLLAVASLHFLDHKYDPFTRFISEYSGGEYAWLSQSAFWMLSLSFTLVTLGLILEMNQNLVAWVPFLLFCIAFVSLGVLTAHPVKHSGPNAHEEVLMHNEAAWMGFICIIAGQALWPLVFYFQPAWRRRAIPLFLLGISTLSYFLIQGIEDFSHRDTALLGLHQRILVGLIWLWMGICTIHLGSLKSAEVSGAGFRLAA